MSSQANSPDRQFPRSGNCCGIFPGISLRFVIFALDDNRLKVLCEAKDVSGICAGWALPSGKIFTDEGVHQSAIRALKEFVTSEQIFCEQLHVFGGAGAAPLTVAYYVLLPEKSLLNVAHEATSLHWWDTRDLPNLARDQAQLVEFAVRELRSRTLFGATVFHLLPAKFTLLQLQQAYETVLNFHISKSNFRRKVAKMRFLVPSQEWQQGVAHRAARLYQFDEELYLAVSNQECLSAFGEQAIP
jgi:Uncharacterized conserved protein